MIVPAEQHIEHYGTPRHSGRYPWGSGGNVDTKRNRDFLDMVQMMREDGLSDAQIAEGLGMNQAQFRAKRSIARHEQTQERINHAQSLQDKGMGATEIGKAMGLPESTVRSYLAPGAKDKNDVLYGVANTLKAEVAAKELVDVSSGAEYQLDVTPTKLNTSLALLQEQGYTIHKVPVPQLGTGENTNTKVLAPPGTEWKYVMQNQDKIKQLGVFSDDGGRTALGIQYPKSFDSKRLGINYREDGGLDADGVVYVRPGVKDIDIGGRNYAQVRIAVDNTHFIKGMAMYKDDLPEGVDLVFNTNKSRSVPLKSHDPKADQVLKPFKTNDDGSVDRDNPFGSTIKRQLISRDSKGNERLTSVMNVVREEGDWDTWTRTFSSQILSKQTPRLAKEQLDMTFDRKKREYDELVSLTNPTVKKKLLESFADDADSSAVHLKSATLPKSSHHVLLPIKSVKPTEVYAPNYKDGTRVSLIRSPHGGRFEIPELKVNNKNREARRLMGVHAKDAVGIHPDVAARLSGADFDGDTVIVVPNDRGKLKSAPALSGLKDFDPKRSFPQYPGMVPISKGNMQNEMGKITNLIADMSLQGANNEELARAVRHSMVVIDSEKHKLDYKGSEKANAIADLKEKYQGGSKRGASTLISRASAATWVPEYKPRKASEGGPVDPKTGKKVFVPTGKMIPEKKKVVDKATGKVSYVETGRSHPKLIESRQLVEEPDAFKLSSGTEMEGVYAAYSNRTKAIANSARKEALHTKDLPYNSDAKDAHPNEVASLNAKLALAERNAPKERHAQRIAKATVSQKRQANRNMDSATVKKISNQALTAARARVGANKTHIYITDEEWSAIQAGAISKTKLNKILNNADLDRVKVLATPRTQSTLTSSDMVRARSMARLGFTQAEIAGQLGVSLTTLKTHLSE